MLRTSEIPSQSVMMGLSISAYLVFMKAFSQFTGISIAHCIAESVCRSKSRHFIFISEPPVITVPPVGDITTEGSSVALQCDVTGTPAPYVQWFHNAVPVSASESVQIVGKLQHPNVSAVEFYIVNWKTKGSMYDLNGEYNARYVKEVGFVYVILSTKLIIEIENYTLSNEDEWCRR